MRIGKKNIKVVYEVLQPCQVWFLQQIKEICKLTTTKVIPICPGFLQPIEGCARATVSPGTFTSSLLKDDIQAVSFKLFPRCSKSQEKQSYISATVDMALSILSILALGLNRYAHHSWEMKMNWWSWIFSQQAGARCSVPPEWIPPSVSPLQQNTQSTAKEWPPCVVLVPGARAGLTSQALTATSLAEPDQQRQGDSKKVGLSFQPRAGFFYL